MFNQMLEALDPTGLKRQIASEECGLDWDEKRACETVAHEIHEVAEAVQLFMVQSVRGRNPKFDQELCDRLEYLLKRQLSRMEDEEIDEHEVWSVG